MALIESLKQNIQLIEGSGITWPLGFLAAGTHSGLKFKNLDTALIVSDRPAAAAGTFTQNVVVASSVEYSRRLVKAGAARAIFCISGNANACTGEEGEQHTIAKAKMTAQALHLDFNEVLIAATGVIGKPLPIDKLATGIPKAARALKSGPDVDENVGAAMLTTDLRVKQIALTLTSPDFEGEVRIGAVAKGSGMIAPNMATTLCFVTTDAKIDAGVLQTAFSEAIETTFNRITVDGDTSTNDMALILANGASDVAIPASGPAYDLFQEGVHQALEALAKEIARDGEGATKLVEVAVTSAITEDAAKAIAKTVAESPLVKTALFGADPNWGRIVAAAGRAGAPFNPKMLTVKIGHITVFANGMGAPFDKSAASKLLKEKDVKLSIDLAQGDFSATFWTCDFSYDYVRINAEYHT